MPAVRGALPQLAGSVNRVLPQLKLKFFWRCWCCGRRPGQVHERYCYYSETPLMALFGAYETPSRRLFDAWADVVLEWFVTGFLVVGLVGVIAYLLGAL